MRKLVHCAYGIIFVLMSILAFASPILAHPNPAASHLNLNCTSQNEIRDYDNEGKNSSKTVKRVRDVGEQLFLTPLLKNGRHKEAKELARVRNLTEVPSYSGFLTVDEKLNSSLFFWFFPAAVSLCCSFQTA
jgi:hypothetical protein